MNTDETQNLIRAKLEAGVTVLDEDDAKKIFSWFQIPVVEEMVCRTANKAAAKTKGLSFPVVLKGICPGMAHKTESGLVRLAIASPEALAAEMEDMAATASPSPEYFLIQPMIKGKREFTAGMFRDPQFGPVIMFGLGGIFTEALKDVVMRVAPLSDADIEDMLKGLVSRKLLGPFRGEKNADIQSLKAVLSGLSHMALACPEIKEIDINPLIVQPDGSPVAVDGLVVLDAPKEGHAPVRPANLKAFNICFYPQSIAFVGASNTPGKWGHMLPASTLSRDFKGKVFLVNPKGGILLGQKAFTSVTEIEEDIDLAVVTIPASRVLDIIPELKAKNVKGMLLITSGFREVGKEGETLERQVVEKAREAGILVLGPNTMGVCNPHAQFYCTAAHAYPLAGSTALVCQSGNMGTQLLAFAEQQDIGIRAFSGSGNEAMVTIEDYMEAFEVDELTKTVVLYIESVKNGRRFLESARRLSGKKPVVVLKGGRTRMGEKAASSHTGAMASDAGVFNAACRQAGIIQVSQPMELLDLSAVFSSLPLPKGNRVAIMTLGGGWGVIASDLCTEHGLEIPSLSGNIVDRLNKVLPDYWSHGNPVDLVGETSLEVSKASLEELLMWDGCDAVIHLGVHGQRILLNNLVNSVYRSDPAVSKAQGEAFKKSMLETEKEYIRYVVDLTQKYEKPVLGVSLLTDEESRTLYRYPDTRYKAVCFPSPERAVKALAGMCRYQSWLGKRLAGR